MQHLSHELEEENFVLSFKVLLGSFQGGYGYVCGSFPLAWKCVSNSIDLRRLAEDNSLLSDVGQEKAQDTDRVHQNTPMQLRYV